jgi:hypothetical protein
MATPFASVTQSSGGQGFPHIGQIGSLSRWESEGIGEVSARRVVIIARNPTREEEVFAIEQKTNRIPEIDYIS